MSTALVPVGVPGGRRERAGAFGAIGAWGLAVLASSLCLVVTTMLVSVLETGTLGSDGVAAILVAIPATLYVAMFVAVLTLFPWTVLVWTERLLGLHRGFADVILGAVMGGGLIQIFGMPILRGEIALTAVFATAGAVGGLTYWVFVGRPK